MERRELIKNIAFISGGLFIGANYLLTGCKNEKAGNYSIGNDSFQLLEEVAETIIPETDTPGAKSANVPEFVDRVFADIYTNKEQNKFLKALKTINDKAIEKTSKQFKELDMAKKAEIFNAVKDPKDKGFIALYQIILFGYLSSEKGIKSNFRYTPVPGKYIGEIPYKKGDKMYVGLRG